MEPIVRLLVVDDDEVDRMIIKRSLRTAKVEAEVYNAAMGSEALQALAQNQFDFIFIDFMLPDMNGLELLQKIRERGITTPVQIVTSQGDERIAVEAMKTGASDYLPKTLLTPEGISQSIRNAVRLHRIEEERLRTEQQLRHTQEQLEIVISGAPIVLWAIDAAGIYTMCRGNGLSLIGLQTDELVGASAFEVFKDFSNVIVCMRRALSGNSAKCTIKMQEVWFDCLFLPIQDQNYITGVIGVCYDITERIAIEEELKNAKDAALGVARVKEQFLANMSHEIRTPMNGILGLAEVLWKTELDEEQREYLKAIQTSANNLMVIINDLLDFSKIEAGKITLESIPFDLKHLVKQLLTILEIRAKERNNTLKFLLDSDIPEFVQGDPVRLSQILNNLIGNALKFTENGKVKLGIEVVAQEAERVFLEFTVTDTGIGIEEEKLTSIFEKFTQGSNDTTRRFGGTGLGLSIAKELVEVQGGKMTVESRLGQGSTFRFLLPFLKTDQQPQTESVQPKEALLNIESLRGAHVLLAEDNPINQLLVKKILAEEQITCQVANNGKEAIELLATQDFDLVLMDMQMPEMDGYEAMQYIRHRMGTKSSIPIIALTAHATQSEATKCIMCGANSFISKPFRAQTLWYEMASVLGGKIKANHFGADAEATSDFNSSNKPAEIQPKEALEKEPLDLSYLREFADGNESFMLEIIEIFLSQTPDQLQELNEAVAVSDWGTVQGLSHKMKSSLALIGVENVQLLNAQIEHAALHRIHTEQILPLSEELSALVNNLICQLRIVEQSLLHSIQENQNQ
ncbi:response regulator [Nibribacter ruber]|uniref:Sensory/regulatory protein RpfC n=1 Tax=Nibribacter ruber TaxID=2698458 RepID=A0A6P1NVX6_9BACT|nr:response regulator [Nibribacter ruber]QHL86128.1 response regulator [Nibribacter ruber]